MEGVGGRVKGEVGRATPCTLHPPPFALHPTPFRLTPHSSPSRFTLHPPPFTLQVDTIAHVSVQVTSLRMEGAGKSDAMAQEIGVRVLCKLLEDVDAKVRPPSSFPYTLHATPHNLHPKRLAINPKLQTLLPTPSHPGEHAKKSFVPIP